MTNSIKVSETCNVIDISCRQPIESSLKSHKKQDKRALKSAYVNGSMAKNKPCRKAKTTDKIEQGRLIGFYNKDDINKIVDYFMNKKQYTNAAVFIFGCNTGFRCGDICSLTVQNCFDKDDDGDLIVKDFITLQEEKTEHIEGKSARTVFLNDISKKALSWIARIKRLRYDEDDFMFFADRPQNQYVNAQSPENICSLDVETVRQAIVRACNELEIFGKYGSHSMRKTYCHFMGLISETDIDILHINSAFASASLGHSSTEITEKHYLNIPIEDLREKNLKLNLGAEAFNAHRFETLNYINDSWKHKIWKYNHNI